MPPRQLRKGLDRDVYHIIRKFEDSGAYSKLTITTVYEAIKASNSSLARQKRRPLEDSIERVLAVRKEEEQEAADGDGHDSDAALEAEIARRDTRAEKDASLLNRQLTKHWNFSAPKSKADYPTGISGSGEMDVDQPAAGVDRQTNGEPKPKRRRRATSPAKDALARVPPSGISTADMAGMEDVLERLINPVWVPLRRGKSLARLGQIFDNAVLLHGPSGCGKTSLANGIAADLGVAYIPISGPSIVAGTSGESEKNIRDCFDEALRLAPCLIFIDEIDSIAGKRDSASKAMEGRIVAEMCACMDKIGLNATPGKNVVVLAATNKPDTIDPVVRRRFGVEVDIGMPNEDARCKILARMLKKVELDEDVDFRVLAKLTPGFVGSDLKRVVMAAMERVSRSLWDRSLQAVMQQDPSLPADEGWQILKGAPDEDEPDLNMRINLAHLKAAVASVQPAARREGFSTIPDTTWAHVGALHDVRRQMETSIMGPIRDPALYAQVGIEPAAGILLWGPPGCGKTLVAKAVANESKANFISIKGPEILSKYVGESERAVRSLFSRARSSAPCILFFDEMDALVPTRGDSLNDSSGRLVNALLTELDGVGDRKGIYVIGATNRPDVIDPAIRRPGRLGTSIFVGLPTPEDRAEILKTIYGNKIKLNEVTESERSRRMAEVEKVALDRRCNGFSGADLGNLMQAAGKHCLERVGLAVGSSLSVVISMADWNKALDEIKPSVRDMHKYEALAE